MCPSMVKMGFHCACAINNCGNAFTPLVFQFDRVHRDTADLTVIRRSLIHELTGRVSVRYTG